MEFKNLTPFDALCYGALDPADVEHRVIAMKVGYRLVQTDGVWHAVVMDNEPLPLVMADEHWGEPSTSSVRFESDLAPFKPKCDVLLNGTAHAPGGKAMPIWPVRLCLSSPAPLPPEPKRPHPLNPYMDLTPSQVKEWERAQALHRAKVHRLREQRHDWLDKRLRITGPSTFSRGLLGWRRSTLQAVTQVPLRWEAAFGGRSLVPDTRTADTPPLLNEACFSNPVGCGWLDKRLFKAAAQACHPLPEQWPAPQISGLEESIDEPLQVQHPAPPLAAPQMAQTAASYRRHPSGLSALGRAWAPRLALAGTYDDAWLEQRHPGLPEDFDFAYWNSAPPDQQIDYPPPDVRLELWHLTDPALTPQGQLSVTLPGHRPYVLMRLQNGVMLPLPMVCDTLLIDTDAMTLNLTHRTWVPAGTQVRTLEARFETNPQAPLIKRPTNQQATPTQTPHG